MGSPLRNETCVAFATLQGKTFTDILVRKDFLHIKNDEIVFTCQDNTRYCLRNNYEYAGEITIDDIDGDLQDLIGTPILLAEESSNDSSYSNAKNSLDESFTWTFYRLVTNQGGVTLRWYGTSSGYYSEKVDLVIL